MFAIFLLVLAAMFLLDNHDRGLALQTLSLLDLCAPVDWSLLDAFTDSIDGVSELRIPEELL